MSCSPGDSLDGDAATFIPADPASIQLAERLSLSHLRVAQPQMLAGSHGLAARQVEIDERGKAHTRVVQTVNGIPVFGAEAIVHLDASGRVEDLTDALARNVHVDTIAALDGARAVQLAKASQPGASRGKATADLQILRGHGKDALTYRVQLDYTDDGGQPARPVVFIDAKTGKVVWSYDNLQTARNREVHNLNHGTVLPGPLARTETGAASGDTDVDTNFARLGSTYDCYSQLFGRDSYDGAGATLISSVHYDSNYVNAFWDGSQMVYGDGDGVNARSLALSMDVTAHELTHAVTDRTSNLIYSGESGGLNEAMSDIFGNVCEWFRDNNGNVTGPTSANTWMVGEDIWLADPALRYMNDPALDGVSRDFWTSTVGSADVHYSSGVANLAFYLLANGGTHPRGKSTTQVSGIGIHDAAQIFYRANTTYLTPSSSFADARVATTKAATDLFGASSNQVAQVGNAWAAVGVLPPPDYQVIDTKTGLASSTQLTFSYASNGATAMKFALTGGTGDADLYVKFGSAPTLSSFDCRPYSSGNNETCEAIPAQSGTYYVMIHAYQAYSGVTLTVSAENGSAPTTETSCTDGADNDGDGQIDCADADCAADPSCQAPTTETSCTDGVDNDADGQIDCADADCAGNSACPASYTVISSADFESGFGPYADGGGDAARISGSQFASSGAFSIQLRDNSGAASSFSTATPMNLSAYSQLRIQYSALAVSMESGEDYFVEVQVNGGAYQTVGNFASGTGFANDVRHTKDLTFALPASATSVRVRFRCDASANNDAVYFDDVVVSAR